MNGSSQGKRIRGSQVLLVTYEQLRLRLSAVSPTIRGLLGWKWGELELVMELIVRG